MVTFLILALVAGALVWLATRRRTSSTSRKPVSGGGSVDPTPPKGPVAEE